MLPLYVPDLSTSTLMSLGFAGPPPLGSDDWREALTAGDCEDIAIAILVMLTAEGFPALGALRFVLCKTETGIAHAVLAVFTDRGDFVLDNRVLGLWPWRSRPYDWVAVEIPGSDRWQTIIDPV